MPGYVDRQRCKRCGRFFTSQCPYDEFCPTNVRSCYWDDKAERDEDERRRKLFAERPAEA